MQELAMVIDNEQDMVDVIELLRKERQQIIDAWQDGYSNGCFVGSNDYTNETENDNGNSYVIATYEKFPKQKNENV